MPSRWWLYWPSRLETHFGRRCLCKEDRLGRLLATLHPGCQSQQSKEMTSQQSQREALKQGENLRDASISRRGLHIKTNATTTHLDLILYLYPAFISEKTQCILLVYVVCFTAPRWLNCTGPFEIAVIL